ncbi:MAG: Gfo/Idh/MocA family oxidoreductase, partial [Saprospiraceae bacterium]
MIAIGIIGWGENGKKIADAFQHDIKNTEVIGIATRDTNAIRYADNKLNIKQIYSSYKEILELHQLEIMCICSSHEN